MKRCAIGILVLALGACGNDDAQKPAAATPETPAVTAVSTASTASDLPVPVAMAREGAVIKGKVVFEGTAPKDKKIALDADPYCSQANAQPMKTEVYVIGKGGEMANVFVWIKKGLEGKKYDPPKDVVELDQIGCRYTPHVLGVMVGQTLKIKNNDDTMHNVHSLSTANPEFNFGQAKKGAETDKVFTSAEFFRIKCDVHGWMSAWVGVVPHPFYVVTGEAGTFELKDLPAGEYDVEAWHEKLGTQTQTVKVGEKESKEISFTFKAPQK